MGIRGDTQTRFGDTTLTFGMRRYHRSDGKPLWRFEVLKYCGDNVLTAIDADPKLLAEMRRFIDQAIELVDTDGGRLAPTNEQGNRNGRD